MACTSAQLTVVANKMHSTRPIINIFFHIFLFHPFSCPYTPNFNYSIRHFNDRRMLFKYSILVEKYILAAGRLEVEDDSAVVQTTHGLFFLRKGCPLPT